MKKNLTVIFLANAIALLSGVATSLLTAWALGAEGRGDLAIIVLFPNIIALAVGLGLPQGSRYFIASEPGRLSSLFPNAVYFAVFTGIIAFIVAEITVPLWIGERNETVMWLVSVYLINIPFALLYDMMAGMLEGARKFKWAAVSRILFFGIQCVAYTFLWLTDNLTIANAAFTMIIAQLANTASAFLSVLLVLRPGWKPSFRTFKDTLVFGIKYHLGVVTSFTTLRLDQLLLAGMATSVEMGLYVIAVRLSEVMTILASSVSEVLMPEVASSEKGDRSMQLLTRSLRQTIYVFIAAMLPLLVLAPYLLEFAFGSEFLAATSALRVLLVASLVWSAGSIVNSGLNGLGYPGLSTLSRASSAVITVITLFVWLPRYGIFGAALSSLAGYSAMFVVALFWLMRKQNLTLGEIFRPQKRDIPMKDISSLLKRSATVVETTPDLTTGFAHQIFEQKVRQWPDRIAITSKDGHLTYGELNHKANQLAWYLRSKGAGPEKLVPICVGRSADMAIGVLGILKSGAAYVPIDPMYPSDRISHMLADSDAALIVTHSDLLTEFDIERICLDTDQNAILQFPTSDPPLEGTPDNLAYVIFTSGSTGRPKGAMLTNANLAHYVSALQDELRLNEKDTYLHLASIGFSSSRRHLLLPLTVGAGVVIADEHQRLDPIPLFELIKDKGVTVFDAVPSFQRHCLQELMELDGSARHDLLDNNLRLIVSASEPLFSDIPRTWIRDFAHPAEHVHMFGQTETSGIIAINRISESDIGGDIKPVPVGKPISNTEILLLDDQQRPVAFGQTGEIYVTGVGVGRGYLNSPEIDSEKFIDLAAPAGTPAARYCKTGDHARLLNDGRLECLGRNDFQVKVRGNRVELSEIEAIFLRSPSVRNCVVTASQDETGEIQIVAYIVTAQRQPSIKDELHQLASTTLPDYMRPTAIVEIDRIPLGVNGKVDRKALISGHPAKHKPAVPNHGQVLGDSVFDTVRAVWTDILGVSPISTTDNFFSLGGHSLMASRMISRVRSTLGVDLHIRTIFDEPTLGSFCEAVELCTKNDTKSPTHAEPPLVRPERIPLSFAQRRIWFLGELDQNLTAYNEHDILKLSGDLNIEALDGALGLIVDRHESMRSNIRSSGGEPFQVIRETVPLDLTIIDRSDSENDEKEVFDIARSARDLPFDLSEDPLFRFILVKTSEQCHYLIAVLHHTISDQWTIDLFLRELNLAYSAEIAGAAPAWEPLPIQYADYAIRQQEWLTSDDYQKQLAYWRAELTGAPGLLELPTDHVRPPVQSYRGSQVTAVVPKEVVNKLNDLCNSQGITMFMALLSAWELLLFRYSGQDQLVVGAPIAGRNSAETENLIGFFVNTLAIRADLSGDPTFEELLRRTKEKAIGAFSNQDFPFEKLVEELNPERNGSYTPIFQVMFTLQNAPRYEQSIGDLRLDRLHLDKDSAKFDLSLDVFQRSNGLELQLEFNTDLFEQSTANRMLEHLRHMLESLIDDPAQHVNTVGLLTDSERALILEEWNSETTPVPDVCVHELIEAQAKRVPERIAVQYDGLAITYRELDIKANQLARYLIRHGVVPGSIVGLHFTKCIDMVVAVVAVMKAGGAYLPMDPNYPIDRLQYMRSEADVSVLVTHEPLRDSASLLGTTTSIYVDGQSSEIDAESVEPPKTTVKPEDLIYVTFTSGSTGHAKGVMIEHRSVANAYAAWEKEYRLSSLASHLQMASFSFDVFTGDLTRALCSGSKLVLCPPDSLLQPEQLERLLTEGEIEAAEFVPAVIRPLIEHLEVSGGKLDHLKLVVVGSDTWQTDEYRRLRAVCGDSTRVINSYGITEATIDSTFFEMDEGGWSAVEFVPIGRPFANTQMYILDQFGNPVPVGFPGEVYQGGNGLARGYLNRPDLTSEKFGEVSLPLTDGAATKRLYRTGDLGKFRSDGTIALMGRADNQVKLRGFRIELGEIESVLSTHPDVGECVVVLREDIPGDKRLIAYIRSRANQFDPEEVRAFLKNLLPVYMVPAAYVPVTEWKLTPNGKIDRKKLPEAVGLTGIGTSSYVAPETETEVVLADVWSKLLRIDRVGIDDDFFDLGGHSLLATQAISRVRDAFGCELPLRAMFETPTIRDIAGRIDALGDSQSLKDKEDEIERLLGELDGITDEQAAEILASEYGHYFPTFANEPAMSKE